MDIGLDLPIDDPPEAFARVVRAVERGGFQALWLVDYLRSGDRPGAVRSLARALALPAGSGEP
jgi:hypothetical protein